MKNTETYNRVEKVPRKLSFEERCELLKKTRLSVAEVLDLTNLYPEWAGYLIESIISCLSMSVCPQQVVDYIHDLPNVKKHKDGSINLPETLDKHVDDEGVEILRQFGSISLPGYQLMLGVWGLGYGRLTNEEQLRIENIIIRAGKTSEIS